MLDHIGLAVSDIERSRRFYKAALKPLGIEQQYEYGPDKTESGGTALGFGRDMMPFFWIGDNERVGEGSHVAFTAPDRATVDAFYEAAIAAGGRDNGPPGLRPKYHPNYYGAFVLDPDGINVEAVCHRPECIWLRLPTHMKSASLTCPDPEDTDGGKEGRASMNGSIRAPKHLWAVGGVSALWNAFGAFNYTMTQTRNEAYLAQITDAQRAYMESFPAWAEAAWALGVWGALAGSLLLLARSRYAVAAFALSLAGLLGTTIYQFGMSALPAEMASGSAIALHVTIWAIAIGLLIYAYRMRARGVLR